VPRNRPKSKALPKFLEKNGSEEPKKVDYQKIKIIPPCIHPIYNCADFNTIGPFFTSLAYPKVLGKNGSEGPKKVDFRKVKIIPSGIHPIYKCAEFQHDWAIVYFSSLPKVLGKNGSEGPDEVLAFFIKKIQIRFKTNCKN